MGSAASAGSLGIDPDIPVLVYQAAKLSSGMIKNTKKQKLLDVIIQQGVSNTKGVIVRAALSDIKCGNMLGSLFDVHHAFVIFEFSSGIWIRCEVSNYKDGTAIFINRIDKFTYANCKRFQCESDDCTILHLIDWANQFYKNGEYHIERRNCYDFVSFMLQGDFQGADVVTKRWKQIEVKKVPSLMRD